MKQRLGVSVLVLLFLAAISRAQAPTAVVNGQVRDASGAAIAGATVEVFNDATHVRYSTETNDEGIYSVPSLPPGSYHIQVSKAGFKTVIHPDITLNVQDAKAIGFTLPVGPISDTVTVEGGALLIDTQSAAVSTVIDRQFAENLPMNGRSFQTLIQLTPGVVLTVNNSQDGGQFSINGQRADANYWTVDGVSANIGISATIYPGQGLGGSLGSFSAQGGTNSLVSVDAMQEFRIQTSTYAPEFGRTPGGQISIVTRSGANQLHGTVFDYLRNDKLDANGWFANASRQPKPEERQNDFGGTFSGPILKDRTFFFFSYEGLRLRLPQTTLTTVPCDSTCTVFGNARTMAASAIQPYLNAYPAPNGPEVFTPCTPNVNGCPASGEQATGAAQFNKSYSNAATLDAYSLRIDHKLSNKLNLFGRYNYSPSQTTQRGGSFGGSPLSTVIPTRITTQTATAGTTWALSPIVANDLRFNYSRTNSSSYFYLDNFGGAIPLPSLMLPSPYTSQNAQFQFDIFSLTSGGLLEVGKNASQLQQQINVVDSLSIQKGSHTLKFGVDFRRLTPSFVPPLYSQAGYFLDVSSAETGSLFASGLTSSRTGTLLFRNLGAFVQDTWRVLPRLTLTYGLRWDVDFAPSSINGPSLAAAVNFNDPAKLALAASGTPVFNTPYGNVAPRLGVAYQLFQSQKWQTVLRGGVGVFYDLATQEAGNGINYAVYPFGVSAINCCFTGSFPLDPAAAAPPPITFAGSGWIAAFQPNLELPYTLQWNLSLEQGLGRDQTISASYIGAVGRRLIQTQYLFNPNPSVRNAVLILNGATSDYDALQLQFQRRLSHHVQALASYTWSHSIDSASAGSFGSTSNTLVPGLNANANRGSSDFDIRNAFSAAVTYEVPAPKTNPLGNAILGGWSLQSIIQARSAPPVYVSDGTFFELNGANAAVRPDIVSGMPFYLYGPSFPGGKALNSAAFKDPPKDASGNPLRQGNLPRNALRGFGATQWDFAAHRDFPIRESVKLQFRAEMFNVLNHPNFGQPNGIFGRGGFGLSTQMLGGSLGGGTAGGGGLSPLYQIGGPRSIQLVLKLTF